MAEGRGRTRDSILVWRPRSDALGHEPARTHSRALLSEPRLGALPSTGAVMRRLPTAPKSRYARCMALSDRQLLDALSRTPFVDSTELVLILGEPHATVHRALSDLLADGIAGRVSHGTAHLPSSQRYHLTASGIRETAGFLGFDTPSDFVRAYPMSKEWLTLLIRRMDAVAAVYRLAASLSPGIDGLRSHVEFPPQGPPSTPPSPFTTAAASAWCARAWPCGAGLSMTG